MFGYYCINLHQPLYGFVFMKKILFLITALLSILPAAATLDGDGYYRVQNYRSGRYCYLTDDKGEMNLAATTFDVGAILLWSGFEKAASDPATIIYIKNTGGKTYALEAQGTSTQDFVEVALYIDKAPTNRDTYAAYGVKGGMRKYLGDTDITNDEQGIASVEAEGTSREWYIHPVGTADNNYFGIKPTILAKGKYYYPFYADFPFRPTSESGMKVYTISRTDGRFAILKEISGIVPAATPVLIECTTPVASDNRIIIGGTGAEVGTNALKGCYFDNSLPTHYNRTAVDQKTMRLLGTDASGNLSFVKSSLQYLPANQSYLQVWDGCEDNIRIVTEAEYEQLRYQPTGISISHQSAKRNVGDTNLQLVAYLTPGDARSTITWTSSNPAVATIDSEGKVTCLAKGSAELKATTDNGLSATCSLTVYPVPASVSISRTEATMVIGETITLSASVQPADVQDASIKWYSDNERVATVDNSGKVTAVASGGAGIRARAWNGVEAMCVLTVNKPTVYPTSVTLSQTSGSISEGETLQLIATVFPEDTTDKTITWTSSKPSVASVSDSGLVTGLSVGATTITATCGTVKATCILSVTKAYINVESIELNLSTLTIREGEQVKLTATVLPSNASDPRVTWSSDNTAIATVSSTGNVRGIKKGETQIYASAGSVSTSCTVVVLEKEAPVILPSSIYLNRSTVDLSRGETTQLTATVVPSNATDKSVTWSSSDPAIATVSDSGLITAAGKGTATISATTVNGLTATVTVTVTIRLEGLTLNPETYSAIPGTEFDLVAGPIPTDADLPSLFWSSSDPTTVLVDQSGHCVIIKEGQASITISGGGFRASSIINCISGIHELLDHEGRATVFTLDGVKISDEADADLIERLPKGIYIINGHKVIR